MRKWLVGYVVLCIGAMGGVLLVLFATGGFSGSSVGLYGEIALALSIVLIVVIGMALMMVALSPPYQNTIDQDLPA